MQNEASVVQIRGLSRRFRRVEALHNVDFDVHRGKVLGLLGENGAGKTTLIKHLLGALKAKEGTVRVFGHDPVKSPEEVLGRIGYLSEDRDMPGWMRVGELMRYNKAFYPKWDDAFAEELREQFELDPKRRIRHLSRGQKAKAGLLCALAHRPELLILDEPSSGLDASVRQHILAAVIRTVAEEGRTVLFSSHLIDEVERVADEVAIIHQGKLVVRDTVDVVKSTHHRLTLAFDTEHKRPPALTGGLSYTPGPGANEWIVVCNGQLDELKASAVAANARIVEEATPSLEEIFLARIRQRD